MIITSVLRSTSTCNMLVIITCVVNDYDVSIVYYVNMQHVGYYNLLCALRLYSKTFIVLT